jgi:hypothetical protein
MPQLYRCSRCHSVLVRDAEVDALLAMRVEDATYECGRCGYLMPARDVLSGSFDVGGEPRSAAGECDSLPILPDVLARLREEHRPGHVYRGQVREWPGPLVPSAYRRWVDPVALVEFPPASRLREVGQTFHELVATPRAADATAGQRLALITYLTQIFGYPVGHLLAQQCGASSECLDVSSDPEIAAFFACFDFERWTFIEGGRESGVIHRFDVDEAPSSAGALEGIDFYSCPPYLSHELLYIFDECRSWGEAHESFIDYLVAAGQTHFTERPISRLRLPRFDLGASRFVRQRAGLLVPDMLLSAWYATQIHRRAPAGKATREGTNAVEDLATRPGATSFRFRHSAESARTLTYDPMYLLPTVDPFRAMLGMFLGFAVPRLQFITELGIVGGPTDPHVLK